MLLEIADHLERLALSIGDTAVARETRFLAHRCIEVEDSEDTFWMSLGGCVRELARNPKARGVSTELDQLAVRCLGEARRIQKECMV